MLLGIEPDESENTWAVEELYLNLIFLFKRLIQHLFYGLSLNRYKYYPPCFSVYGNHLTTTVHKKSFSLSSQLLRPDDASFSIQM